MNVITKNNTNRIIKASKFTATSGGALDIYHDLIIFDKNRIAATDRMFLYCSELSDFESEQDLSVEVDSISEDVELSFDNKKGFRSNGKKISQNIHEVYGMNQEGRLISIRNLAKEENYDVSVDFDKALQSDDILGLISGVDLLPYTRLVFSEKGIYFFISETKKGFLKNACSQFQEPISFDAFRVKTVIENVKNSKMFLESKKSKPIYKSDKKGIVRDNNVKIICFKNKKELSVLASMRTIPDKILKQVLK
jgi:hypothetical protein